MAVDSASPVVSVAPLFEIERERLLALLNGLDDRDWHRPSPCPEWTVLGLAGHLLGDDLGLLSRRRDGYFGTAPPDGQSEGEFIDWLDELQLEWVQASRRISPRLLIELLGWSGPRLVELLRGEDLSRRTAMVSWAGPATSPVWLDQLRELSEYWIHRQQLLEALDRPADLDPMILRPILLALRWAFPHRLSQVGPLPGGVIDITISAPIDEQWTLVDVDGEWEFTTDVSGPVIARVAMNPDEAWRLLTNNLRGSSELIDITGDETAARAIRSTRAIIGHPKG